MEFEELKEFQKDVKKLSKKYRSIHDDINVVKQVLKILPKERPPFSYWISNLGIETCMIKVKKIACKSLKGKGVNSGLRLVYAHFGEQNLNQEKDDSITENPTEILVERIVFIELYHKSDKPTEDRERILDNFN